MVSTRSQTSSNGSSSHSNGHSTKNGKALHDSVGKPLSAHVQHSIVGTLLMPLFLLAATPNFIMVLWYTVKYHDGSFAEFAKAFLSASSPLHFFVDIWSRTNIATPFTLYVIFGYMLYQILLMKLVPGPRAEGPVTPNGNIPVYVDNGFRIFIITMITFTGLTFYLKSYTQYSPSLVYDNFGDLLATMNVFSLMFCVVLYFKGLLAPSTTDSGTSGNPLFDYYWGTELYPRIFGIDIKVFTNCRFGCTVWAILPCCYTMKAYELYGFDKSINSFVSLAILLVYLTKFFWWEAGYMCTIDIILDRAGFYICWGCLCYIPGLYTIFGYYLASHPIALGYTQALSILGAGLACVAINYIADWQRQDVRATNGKTTVWGRKPEIIRAKYITSTGEEKSSILLVSGFWGLARHFHYLPELGLAFFWTLPSGFSHVLPYSYFLFLTALLIHRTYRDDIKCTEKYGTYWKQYKEKVPYRIIPFVY